jgi:hypothetical protein
MYQSSIRECASFYTRSYSKKVSWYCKIGSQSSPQSMSFSLISNITVQSSLQFIVFGSYQSPVFEWSSYVAVN